MGNGQLIFQKCASRSMWIKLFQIFFFVIINILLQKLVETTALYINREKYRNNISIHVVKKKTLIP